MDTVAFRTNEVNQSESFFDTVPIAPTVVISQPCSAREAAATIHLAVTDQSPPVDSGNGGGCVSCQAPSSCADFSRSSSSPCTPPKPWHSSKITTPRQHCCRCSYHRLCQCGSVSTDTHRRSRVHLTILLFCHTRLDRLRGGSASAARWPEQPTVIPSSPSAACYFLPAD